jgi:hypothetical protein
MNCAAAIAPIAAFLFAAAGAKAFRQMDVFADKSPKRAGFAALHFPALGGVGHRPRHS